MVRGRLVGRSVCRAACVFSRQPLIDVTERDHLTAATRFPPIKDVSPSLNSWRPFQKTGDSPEQTPVASPKGPISVGQVFERLVRHPVRTLLHRWNWKSAVLSTLLRATLFFFTNLSAGLPAALAAMNTEFLFRGVTSGSYGALTEAFREAEPPWGAAVTVMILLPIANHSFEFLIHWMRGTRKLLPSIVASVILTAISTLFNFYAMRRGALIVGAGRRSLGHDLLRLPRLFLEFVCWCPRRLHRSFSRRPESATPHDH